MLHRRFENVPVPGFEQTEIKECLSRSGIHSLKTFPNTEDQATSDKDHNYHTSLMKSVR